MFIRFLYENTKHIEYIEKTKVQQQTKQSMVHLNILHLQQKNKMIIYKVKKLRLFLHFI